VLHLVGATDLAGAIVHATSLHRSGRLSVGPHAKDSLRTWAWIYAPPSDRDVT